MTSTSKKQGPKRNEKGQLLPGHTANPNGRPKKDHSITEVIRSMFDESPDKKRLLGDKIIQMAMRGDATAIKLLWNYLDGMPVQSNINTDATLADLIKSQEDA